MIRCVAFDLDGVLIPSEPSFVFFEAEHKITRSDFDEFFSGPYQLAMLGKAELLDVLPDALAKWGWRGTPEEFATLWMRSAAAADPRASELVVKLRASGVLCYAASNQDNQRADYLSSLSWLAPLFDRQFYSCRLGVMKPSPEYFETIQREANLPVESLLFVDDRIENVEGARRCGWAAEMCTGAADLRIILGKYFPDQRRMWSLE